MPLIWTCCTIRSENRKHTPKAPPPPRQNTSLQVAYTISLVCTFYITCNSVQWTDRAKYK